MGLKEAIGKKVINHYLGGYMKSISAFIAWFNAVPGRKRGVAAAVLAAAAALQSLGHQEWASALTTTNDWIQTSLVPGMDVAGGVMALVGLLHPLFSGHASNKQ